jgi:hypothetical protein
MSIQPTNGLTKSYPPELERQIIFTVSGMAFFAESGPFDTVCGQCLHLNDKINKNHNPRRYPGCVKYLRLTGQHGDSVPRNTPSCKYFERSK